MYAKKTVEVKPGEPRSYYSYWGTYERESEKAFQKYLQDHNYTEYCRSIFELRLKYNVVGAVRHISQI